MGSSYTLSNIFIFFSRYALQHGGRVLLADEMGLGKTLQAMIIYLNYFCSFYALYVKLHNVSHEYALLALYQMTYFKHV